MMQTPEDWAHCHSGAGRHLVSVPLQFRWHAFRRVGNPWTKRTLWSRRVEVTDPFREDPVQVALTEWDYIVQALTADCAYRPLANGIGLRGLHGRLENLHT